MKKETVNAANLLIKKIKLVEDQLEKFTTEDNKQVLDDENFTPSITFTVRGRNSFYSKNCMNDINSSMQDRIDDIVKITTDQVHNLLKKEKSKLEKELENLKD